MQNIFAEDAELMTSISTLATRKVKLIVLFSKVDACSLLPFDPFMLHYCLPSMLILAVKPLYFKLLSTVNGQTLLVDVN